MSITKLSANWACQMGPIHCPKFLLPGTIIRQKICTTQNFLRSTAHGPLWLAHELRREPIFVRLVFSNEKACLYAEDKSLCPVNYVIRRLYINAPRLWNDLPSDFHTFINFYSCTNH